MIDDDIAVVGSYNFDCRSTYVDTETMLVVQGKEITKQLNDDFDELKTESLKVHPDGSYRSSENIKIPTVKGDRTMKYEAIRKTVLESNFRSSRKRINQWYFWKYCNERFRRSKHRSNHTIRNFLHRYETRRYCDC